MFVLKSMKVMVQNDEAGRARFVGGGELAAFADAAASSPQVNQSLSLELNRKTKTIIFGGFSQGSDIGIIEVTSLCS